MTAHRKKLVQEGDLVEIPLPDGRVAIGWVLHVSQKTKNAFSFIVFGIKGVARDDIKIDNESGMPTSMKVLGPIYTHVDNPKLAGWEVFSHQPISESKRQLTKRRVAAGIYVGDEFIGTVQELNAYDVPEMLMLGMPLIYKEITKAFPAAK